MGKAKLEAKIIHKIVGICQAVLYEIFLDIHKYYVALGRWSSLAILEEYGVYPQIF